MAKSVSDGSSSDEPSSSQASGVSSRSGTGNTSGAESTSDSSFSLARSETRLVNRSKLLVFGVITLAAGLLGCMIFLLLTQEETTTFHIEFTNHAEEIIELIHVESQSAFQAIDTLSVLITSMTLNRNDSWPNITVPHFELRGVEINKLGNADQTTFVPLVKQELRQEWEAFAQESKGWLNESLYWQGELVAHNKSQLAYINRDLESQHTIPKKLWAYENGQSGSKVPLDYNVHPMYGYFAPVWQQVPAPGMDSSIINYDLMSRPDFQRLYRGLWESRMPVLSEAMDVEWLTSGALVDERGDPKSLLMTPVYSFFDVGLHARDDLAGLLVSVIHWKSFFEHLLVEGVDGFDLVLHNSCEGTFTYTINGPEAVFKGVGDLHDTKYTDLGVDSEFAPFLKHNFSDAFEHCEYDVVVYPSATLDDSYHTNKPALYTSIVLLVFFFTAMVFLFYDYLVQRRQNKVMATAKRTNAIVSSLFPSNVRDRILRDAEEQAEIETREKKAFGGGFGGKNKYKDLFEEGDLEAGATVRQSTKPIADLYPEVTVMFADIVGFTAWSSVREPAQVFTLLETLFASFDEIADRRRVFKVETVGDCYVAVAGLPDPRKDHAIVMARFARDVMYKMNDLTKRLEVELGPDTGDLALRVGLHSGQVTAGVLRGDKSRFQLFGDTMNTCSRIESTGERNKIHISAETAACLHALGKGSWVQERDDIITAKGKGNLQTYWLNFRPQSAPSTRSGSSENDTEAGDDPQKVFEVQKATTPQSSYGNDMVVSARTSRLIEWNVDVLKKVLQQIQVRRVALGTDKAKFEDPQDSFEGSILDEVKEIITLPNFESSMEDVADKDSIELNPKAIEQLREYITMISQLYRENPFHCFEHASHVTMSVTKLLSRIIAPDVKKFGGAETSKDEEGGNVAARLHDHTYGICSDPLTQFACIFAALIHDVDHQGIPNSQLIKENATIAAVYNNKSIAEQNSLDIAWELMMDPQFVDLRAAIYVNKAEYYHFRQLLVNAVMATDIMDKDAGAFRKQRWEKAFSEQAMAEEAEASGALASDSEHCTSSSLDAVNRKATIVIEHLIQASDVSHTMQHWHIYSKWNERLFEEMYRAYQQGRAEKDPSETWYAGEIGFFDYYVIPLAKKLKACGVFGVSSDEYLNYAVSNRKEWEAVGKERVETMVAKFAPAPPQAAAAPAEAVVGGEES